MDQLSLPVIGSVSERVRAGGSLGPQTMFSLSFGSASAVRGLPRVRVTRGER